MRMRINHVSKLKLLVVGTRNDGAIGDLLVLVKLDGLGNSRYRMCQFKRKQESAGKRRHSNRRSKKTGGNHHRVNAASVAHATDRQRISISSIATSLVSPATRVTIAKQ